MALGMGRGAMGRGAMGRGAGPPMFPMQVMNPAGRGINGGQPMNPQAMAAPGMPIGLAAPGIGAPNGAFPQPGPPGGAPPAPPPNLQRKSDWAEYESKDGTKFYYNKKTKESTWKKPEELKTAEEKAAGDTWQICFGPGGRKYYYNKETKESVWNAPKEIIERTKKIELQEQMKKDLIAIRAAAPTFQLPKEEKEKLALDQKKKKEQKKEQEKAEAKKQEIKAVEIKAPKTGKVNIQKVEKDDKKPEEKIAPKKPMYTNKEEAVEAFKSLLKDKGVKSRDKWSQIMQKIIHDPRYQALRTVKERKGILLEFQEENRIREEEERIQAEKKARKMFQELLESCDWIDGKTKWADFEEKCEDDERFKIVGSTRDRKDYFYDYVDDLEEKARKERNKKRKDNMTKLKEFLKSDECKWMSFETTWREAKENGIDDNEFAKNLEKNDRIDTFEEVSRELRDLERERKAKEKEKRRKLEKKYRDNFRELLNDLAMKGELHSKSDWEEIEELVKEEKCYVEFSEMKKLKITPSDVFEDFAKDLEDRLSSPKRTVKNILKKKTGGAKADSDAAELFKQIKDEKELGEIDEEDIKLSVFVIIAKAKHKQKEKEKKRLRYLKELERDFTKYIGRAYADKRSELKDITLETAIKSCSSKMTDSNAFDKTEQEKKEEIFEMVKKSLLTQPMDEEKENDKSKKKKKRKRESASEHESDDSSVDKKKKKKKSKKAKKSKR
eukprot:CAMPEP_0167758326 /NCGR_PEP_ID=MMETSP0110_2-20121227/10408_1 /TAXON_ID=629695 /ORGANISM="Gymnochlora sp., Strain CCMP2014" /LENGTH=724 /DNA_ID=CAMNT_0007644593 /DNA_START=33 /DNA_END=2207 /DNA_ORIENTATION=-